MDGWRGSPGFSHPEIPFCAVEPLSPGAGWHHAEQPRVQGKDVRPKQRELSPSQLCIALSERGNSLFVHQHEQQ